MKTTLRELADGQWAVLRGTEVLSRHATEAEALKAMRKRGVAGSIAKGPNR